MSQSAAQVAGSAARAQGWQPMTFRERGVAVPFTTPHLAGARLRAVGRLGPELVLPEVVGPGSVGILAWERVGSLCSPTLFDRRLGTRLAALPALTPATVRQAVCAEAAAGLAGPEAQEAAATARQQDAADEERARAALPAGGAAASGLTALAALFGPLGLGLGRDAETARVPRTLAAMAALAEALGDPKRIGGLSTEADLVAAAARRAAGAARAALLAARTLAADPPALLRRWTASPEALADELGARRVAAGRLGVAVPPLDLPRRAARPPGGDAAGDGGPGAAAAARGRARRRVPRRGMRCRDTLRTVLRGGDWRSGITPQDMIARNERLLAGVLALPGATP